MKSLSPAILLPLLGLVGAYAGEKTSTPDAQLVIKHGVINNAAGNPQATPATLRELSDMIMRRYPPVTINLVGVESVTVDDLTLRWPPNPNASAVFMLLKTLAAATGNQFNVEQGGEFMFLLTKPRSDGAARRIEVFNLQLYLEGPGDRRELEIAMRELETSLELHRKQLEEANAARKTGQIPESEVTGRRSQVSFEQNRLEILRQALKRKNLGAKETNQRIEELLQVVNDTLQKFSPGEKAPEYEYHAGTHLLIVIGSEAAIDVTRKVVNALQQAQN